jgi:subtilisin family serine protease
MRNAVNHAYNRGVIVVASAGNDGINGVGFPARYANVIGVGGSSNGITRVSWSNYGVGLDIMALGSIYTTSANGSYGSVSGTSFSAPLVAGAIALLKSYRPEATNEQILQALYDGLNDM